MTRMMKSRVSSAMHRCHVRIAVNRTEPGRKRGRSQGHSGRVTDARDVHFVQAVCYVVGGNRFRFPVGRSFLNVAQAHLHNKR